MDINQKIKELTQEFYPKIVEWRRHLHANPELAFEETQTAQFISEILQKHQVKHQAGVAKTGVVALIEGKNPKSRCIALRADMDALPIEEKNIHTFVSKNKGVMHACGHDYHTATLLGTAVILQSLKNEWQGSIKCIFQPSEEKIPSGAPAMIAEGVLENPKVDCIIGQHVSPELEVGKIGFCSGQFMASADEIYLNIKGKGGHAAFPENINDPVIASAHILTALQQVVSRRKNPFEPAVLSFGKIEALGATNIIPNQVKIAGTLRAMNEKWRFEAHQQIKQIAQNTAEAVGCTAEVNIKVGYPCLYNDENLTLQAQSILKENLNQEKIISVNRRMGAEDFAYYSQKVPACFVRIGTGSSTSTQNGLHTNNFDIDEKAIESSVQYFCYLAIYLFSN